MSDTLNWDELDHSDDWPDRTTREEDMVPDEEGQKYLAELEKRLLEKYEDPAVQQWAADNLGEQYAEGANRGNPL